MECDSSDPKTQKLIEEAEEDIRKLLWLIVMAESVDPDESSEWSKQIEDDLQEAQDTYKALCPGALE